MITTSRLSSRALLLCAAVALGLPAGRAADTNPDTGTSTARVKFSDPAKPGTLRFSLPWAGARITGTDGNEVIVTSTLDQKGGAEVDHEGFRRLDDDATFELTEKDNVAVIRIAGDNAWASQGTEFEIKVPRNTNLILRTEVGGDVEVDGVEGDLDINSMNGEVVLRDIVSSAVVNTLNGEIQASFKRAPIKPVSFSSMNGEIDVHLPGDTKANLRMRTHNGSIRTNFPEGVLQSRTDKSATRAAAGSGAEDRSVQGDIGREMAQFERDQARAMKDAARAAAEVARATAHRLANNSADGDSMMPPIPPIPPMPYFGGKSIIGTLNGGGVDIKLTSMNGTITVREAK